MTTTEPEPGSAGPLHEWDLTPEAARDLQWQLEPQVRVLADGDAPPHPPGSVWETDGLPRLVAGIDVSYGSEPDDTCYAAVAVWDRVAGELVEMATTTGPTPFPYVPGLLSFREAPIALQTIAKLQTAPGAFIFDGQGIAHPRFFGIASHLGLWLSAPTVGVAKTWLVGAYDAVGSRRGDHSPMVFTPDPERDLRPDGGVHDPRRVGAVLTTSDGVKPVFVSPGHLVSHQFAIQLVLACDSGFRIPQPTRLADLETKRMHAAAS